MGDKPNHEIRWSGLLDDTRFVCEGEGWGWVTTYRHNILGISRLRETIFKWLEHSSMIQFRWNNVNGESPKGGLVLWERRVLSTTGSEVNVPGFTHWVRGLRKIRLVVTYWCCRCFSKNCTKRISRFVFAKRGTSSARLVTRAALPRRNYSLVNQHISSSRTNSRFEFSNRVYVCVNHCSLRRR